MGDVGMKKRKKASGKKSLAASRIRKFEGKLPKEYEKRSLHRENLEATLRMVFSGKQDGTTLAKVTKALGFSVLQCNEYFNTLIKFGQITRKRKFEGRKSEMYYIRTDLLLKQKR